MTRLEGNRRFIAAALALLGLLLLAAPGVQAQAVYGSIAGTVATPPEPPFPAPP